MYKHNASSIKETAEKRFISKADKAKYDAISSDCADISNTYNRAEIDEKIKNKVVQSTANITATSHLTLPYKVNDVEEGYLDNVEIFGNSENSVTYEHKYVSMTKGKTIDDTGTVVDGSNIISSDFIQVNRNNVVEFHAKIGPEYNTYKRVSFIAHFYNADKVYAGSRSRQVHSKLIVPYGVTYIKIETTDTSIDVTSRTPHVIIGTKDRNITSVGEKRSDGNYDIKVKTVGKNLFDINKVKNYNDLFVDGKVTITTTSTHESLRMLDHYIKLKPNTTYTLSANCEIDENSRNPEMFIYTHTVNFKSLGGDVNYWYRPIPIRNYLVDPGILYGTFTTGDDDFYIRIRLDHNGSKVSGVSATTTFSNFMLYEGEFERDLEYCEYVEYETVITSPCQLHRVGNIHDGLTIKDNKLIIQKRIKEYTFNGKSAHYYLNSLEAQNFPQSMVVFASFADNPHLDVKPSCGIIADKFDGGNYYSLEECLFAGTYAIAFQIHNNRFNGERNIYGFIEWIKENPIKAIFPVNEPTVLEYDLITKPLIKTIKGCMHIESPDAIQFDKFNATVPTSLKESITRNNNTLKVLKDEIKDVENLVKQSAFSIENNKQLTMIKANGGVLDGIEIQGKTLINAIDERFYMSELNLTPEDGRYSDEVFHHVGSGDAGTMTIKDGFISVTKTALSGDPGYSNFFLRRKMLNVKPNTTYTYIVEVVENNLVSDNSKIVAYFGNTFNVDDINNSHHSVFNKYNWGIKLYSKEIGVFKFPVRTVPKEKLDVINLEHIGDRAFIRNVAEGTIKLRIALVEGDHTNTDIKTITPKLITVGDDNKIEVKTTNKNLLDIYKPDRVFPSNSLIYSIQDNSISIGDNITTLVPYTSVSYYVYLDGNKKYRLKYNQTLPIDDRYIISCKFIGRVKSEEHNVGRKVIDSKSLDGFDIEPTYGDGWYKIAFMATYNTELKTRVNFTNVGLYEITDTGTTDTLNNENHRVSIDLSKYGIEGGLKSIADGTCDRIVKKNNKYYIEQNIGCRTLTGAMNWYLSDYYTNLDTIQAGLLFAALPEDEQPDLNSVPVCDRIPGSDNHISTTEVITFKINAHNEHTIYVRKPGKYLPTKDFEGFKKWITNNPLTIHYKLKYPKLIEITEDLDMKLFDGITRLEIDSKTVTPNAIISHSGALENTIQSLLCDVKQLSNSELSDANLSLNSIYMADLTNYMIDVTLMNNQRMYDSVEYDHELFELIYSILLCNKYSIYDIEQKIDFFCIINKLSFEMCDILFNLIYENK